MVTSAAGQYLAGVQRFSVSTGNVTPLPMGDLTAADEILTAADVFCTNVYLFVTVCTWQIKTQTSTLTITALGRALEYCLSNSLLAFIFKP